MAEAIINLFGYPQLGNKLILYAVHQWLCTAPWLTGTAGRSRAHTPVAGAAAGHAAAAGALRVHRLPRDRDGGVLAAALVGPHPQPRCAPAPSSVPYLSHKVLLHIGDRFADV